MYTFISSNVLWRKRYTHMTNERTKRKENPWKWAIARICTRKGQSEHSRLEKNIFSFYIQMYLLFFCLYTIRFSIFTCKLSKKNVYMRKFIYITYRMLCEQFYSPPDRHNRYSYDFDLTSIFLIVDSFSFHSFLFVYFLLLLFFLHCQFSFKK